ncbi:MAG TPA: hypothetical protein VMT76_17560 [Puia sp.]|nr:hypothetical protein [Puia sp.]
MPKVRPSTLMLVVSLSRPSRRSAKRSWFFIMVLESLLVLCEIDATFNKGWQSVDYGHIANGTCPFSIQPVSESFLAQPELIG